MKNFKKTILFKYMETEINNFKLKSLEKWSIKFKIISNRYIN